MDTDVLIVGAGPTGLMLANQLARRGVRVLIIDRHAGPSLQTRALGVQARTLEIYAQLGIVERALELGKRGTGANIWAQGRKMARVPLGEAGQELTPLSVHPHPRPGRQRADHGRQACASWGMSVQWNTELIGLAAAAGQGHRDAQAARRHDAQDHGRLGRRMRRRAQRRARAERHHVSRARPTSTCSSSPIREVTGSMVPDEVNVYLWREGFHLLFPMRGKDHWRIVGILPPELRDRDDLNFEAVIPSLRNEAGAGLSFKTCTWFSTYRIHHRSASRFRDRRCFLLGDAAHIHSPVGAQGMNTGLQDAYNLAWKLALVVKDQADARCSIPTRKSACRSRSGC